MYRIKHSDEFDVSIETIKEEWTVEDLLEALRALEHQPDGRVA